MSTVELLARSWDLPPGTREFMEMCDLLGPMMRIDLPDGVTEIFAISDEFVCLTTVH